MKTAVIIVAVDPGGIEMCREGWLRHWPKEREASRLLGDELEHARPLTDPAVAEEEVEVVLEKREQRPLQAEHGARHSVGPRSRRRARRLAPAEQVEIRATPFA